MQPGDLFDKEPASPTQELMQRESLHFNRQKFQKDAAKLRQLLLTAGIVKNGEELQREVEVTGLDFSVPQLRAAAAIYNLLDRTDFQGNVEPAPPREYQDSYFLGSVPRLQFTCSEFFRLYGIKSKRDGRFDCQEAEAALKALKSLAKSWRVVYRKPVDDKPTAGKKGAGAFRTVVVDQGLISIASDYGILERNASEEIVRGDAHEKVRQITIQLSPIWIDQIGSRYLRRPVSLYQEIRDFHEGRRCSDAVYKFADYTLTLDLSPIQVGVETLERRLWLDRHRKQGQPGRVRKAIDDALETALHVRLLKNYDFDGMGSVTLYLNPERCKLLAAKRPDELSEDDDDRT